jgi:pimeloyl-ACP methyl ester carboxylesterase
MQTQHLDDYIEAGNFRLLYLQRWRHLAPHAGIVEIDQAGHLVKDDQPELVTQLLLHFLASSRRGALNSDV